MRELLFKVWDSTPSYELMTAEISLEDIQNGFNVTGKYRTALQWTGLLDKSGKRIYEGDIVGFKVLKTDDMSVVREVAFRNGNFVASPGLLSLVSDRCEVIGNIYEHPHLLKETK